MSIVSLLWFGWVVGFVMACSEPSASVDSSLPTDLDQDGYDSSVDCDDTNPDVFPGAVELCSDGIDNNCDGNADTDPECVDPCAAAAARSTYYGCEFYAADLPQHAENLGKAYAIVLSNPSVERTAQVVISDVDGVLVSVEVPPLELYTFEADGRAHNIAGGGVSSQLFRIDSDSPIVAYQFNSLDTIGAATTDASLLIPTHAFDRDYWALNYVSAFVDDSFITIFAATPDTTVTVTTDHAVDGPLTATLAPFEALTVVARDVGVTFTGARIEADAPIGVFAGNRCANVPSSRTFCDHLEQQLFPRVAYGTNYLVGKFHARRVCDPPDRVRVVADRDNTSITVNPPVAGPWVLNAGEWREFAISQSVEIASDNAIMVGHFLSGSGADDCDQEGDPLFVLRPPVEQFRRDYIFLTPPTYETDYVDIIAPLGSQVRLDGVPLIINNQAIGATGYSLTSVVVADGEHRVDADVPVGLIVYGMGSGTSQNVSYGYPAGLNLQRINIE